MSAVALTAGEANELRRLEAIVADGLQSFIAVGNALLDIRDARLYRSQFSTFEDYCRKKWKMSKTHANRLILGYQTSRRIEGPAPASESQVRALTKVPAERQKEVWHQVVSSKGPAPTAKDVKKAVEAALGHKSRPAQSEGFIRRLRVIHCYTVWATSRRFSKEVVDETQQWLRENL